MRILKELMLSKREREMLETAKKYPAIQLGTKKETQETAKKLFQKRLIDVIMNDGEIHQIWVGNGEEK